jgi:hypothetical protein
MGGQVVNLFVIMAIGVIIAELVSKWQGTQCLLSGLSAFWTIGVNGMLNTPSNPQGGPQVQQA